MSEDTPAVAEGTTDDFASADFRIISIRYPRPLTHGEEELLIAYFQTYTKKMKRSFAQGATILGVGGKGEMGAMFKNASERIQEFVRLEKPTPQGYRFMVRESILKATDLPLPAQVKNMIYGGSQGIWSRLRNRICNDLKGKLAQRMKFKADDVEITLNDSG